MTGALTTQCGMAFSALYMTPSYIDDVAKLLQAPEGFRSYGSVPEVSPIDDLISPRWISHCYLIGSFRWPVAL